MCVCSCDQLFDVCMSSYCWLTVSFYLYLYVFCALFMVSVAHTSSECICENEWERMCVVDLYNDHVKAEEKSKL